LQGWPLALLKQPGNARTWAAGPVFTPCNTLTHDPNASHSAKLKAWQHCGTTSHNKEIEKGAGNKCHAPAPERRKWRDISSAKIFSTFLLLKLKALFA
jgi:hypothetical protein